MRYIRTALIGLLWVVTFLTARGVEPDGTEILRPVNSSWMLDAGSSHLADTYLSPLKYTGWNGSLEYERLQAMKFSPRLWRQQLHVGIELSNAENRARNGSMLYGNLYARWGMMRVWQLPGRLSVAAGGSAGGNIGGIYARRNGNNPAAVKADLTANFTGWLTWRLDVGRMPVLFRWQTTLPLTGVFFSPDYDELYYEIYLGNHSGLVHWAWPGNFFRWDNLVTADLDFATTRLRVGFRSRILSTEVSNITTRIFSYSFVLGVTGDWFSVSPRRGITDSTADIIYAY